MKNNLATTIVSIALLGAMAFLILFKDKNDQSQAVQEANDKTLALAATSADRVRKSVLTVPPENALVGLQNGVGVSRTDKDHPTPVSVTLRGQIITQFLPGSVINKPRLDAISAADLNIGKEPVTPFIFLFHDRGDAAIHRSHAEFESGATIENISVRVADNPAVDYEIVVTYVKDGLSVQKVIVVDDGRFRPVVPN